MMVSGRTHYFSAPSLREDLSGDTGITVADDTAEQFAKGVQLHNEKDSLSLRCWK